MLGHECRHAWLVPDSMRFPGERGVEPTPAMRMPQRRFPAPWSVEETDACFIVRDAGGQALAYVYFEEELPELLRKAREWIYRHCTRKITE